MDDHHLTRNRIGDHLNELPSLPTVVARLMTLDREGESFFDELLSTVESEPGLSTRVLARANSAISGSNDAVTTVRGALARIGSHAASDTVLSMAMTSVFVPRDEWERSLWRHSIEVASAARALSQAVEVPRIDPDQAYACGLLHDIGRFVMFREAPEELHKIDEGGWNDPHGLLDREIAVCGMTHAELGATACRRWGIPEEIATVVQDHHAPAPPAPLGGSRALTSIVQAADMAMFSSAMPGTPSLSDLDQDSLQETMRRILPAFVHMSESEFRELISRVTEQAGETASALGVAGP